jgi:hypothetical protein
MKLELFSAAPLKNKKERVGKEQADLQTGHP